MYLDTNVSALLTETALSTTMAHLQTTENQAATGNALVDPATNPAASMMATLSQGQLGVIGQASHNVHQGIALLNTASGVVQSDIQMAQQLETLAVQASNSTNTVQDRADLQSQVQALLTQIDQNSQTAYNGIPLFQGASVPDSSSTNATSTSPGSTTPTWQPLAWPNTTEENNLGGQYGSFSTLVQSNLPSLTPAGAPAEYNFNAAVNFSSPYSGTGNIVIAAYSTGTTPQSAQPEGLWFLLTQASTTVPTSGTLSVSTSDTSIPGYTVKAYIEENGISYAYASGSPGWNGPVSLTFHYQLGLEYNSAGTVSHYNGDTIFGFTTATATSTSSGSGSSGGSAAALGITVQSGGSNQAADRTALNLPRLTTHALGLSSVSLATEASAAAGLTQIQSVLRHLTTIQAHIGASLDQLTAQAGNLASAHFQTQAAQATWQDANFATISARMARQQLLMQTGMAALVRSEQQDQAIMTIVKNA